MANITYPNKSVGGVGDDGKWTAANANEVKSAVNSKADQSDLDSTNTALAGKQAALGFTPENAANKDASGGYPGLTLLKINFKNAANTIISFFTNANTAARTYTFQDRDGIIADNTDLAAKEAIANKENTTLDTSTSKYPTNRLVKEYVETTRVQSVTSSATVTPNASTDDMVVITAQAASLTLANPSGTPTQGQGIVIRIKDNGTARAISYGSEYRAIGITLPTITVIGKTLYLAMVRNSTDTKWDVVSSIQEF